MQMHSQKIQGHTHLQQILPSDQWIRQQDNHQLRMKELIEPYLEQRSRQMKNPVLDFLFEYYNFRPTHLYKWSPGMGVGLEYNNPDQLPSFSELSLSDGIAWLDPGLIPEKRVRSFRWIVDVLRKSGHKKPHFGCFGMHEWAMVYRAGEVRHQQIPMRLSDDDIAGFVESRPIVCTHFDAFRFFTDRAKPMNKHPLNRDNFAEMEQPGCIHTNMDLYKWAFKLYPWISGDLLADTFLNAVDTRKTDMQASPYDVRSFGLEPIRIETEEGRREYLERQMAIFQRSQPLRERLIGEYNRVLRFADPKAAVQDSNY